MFLMNDTEGRSRIPKYVLGLNIFHRFKRYFPPIQIVRKHLKIYHFHNLLLSPSGNPNTSQVEISFRAHN